MKRILAALLLTLGLATPAFAVDTLEPFPEGNNSIEFYFGADGLGKNTRQEGSFFQNFQYDYGITDKLSLYLLEEASLSNSDASDFSLAIGVYYPVLDSKYFDLDLGFELGTSLYEESLTASPFLELTFDVNDIRTWGLFVMAKENIGGHLTHGIGKVGFDLSTELSFGTYFTIAETHQFLLAYSMEFIHKPEFEFAKGPLALGYNVMLNDLVELITEVDFNIPEKGDDFSVGFSVGLIIAF